MTGVSIRGELPESHGAVDGRSGLGEVCQEADLADDEVAEEELQRVLVRLVGRRLGAGLHVVEVVPGSGLVLLGGGEREPLTSFQGDVAEAVAVRAVDCLSITLGDERAGLPDGLVDVVVVLGFLGSLLDDLGDQLVEGGDHVLLLSSGDRNYRYAPHISISNIKCQ